MIKNHFSNLRLGAAMLAAAAVLAGPAAAQADFSMFVQLGDSLTAGYMDGCWVEHGQRDSYGALVARQAGVSFEQPLLGEPGLGSGIGPGKGCLVLTSLAPTFGRKESVLHPLNLTLARPYNNMAVPGYKIGDVVKSKSSQDNGNPLTDLVLRGQGFTALQQAGSLHPTFVTIFIGNNDVLGAAGVGTAIEGVTVTPIASAKADIETIIGTMKAAQGGTGKGVVFTCPDVTAIPFTTTIPPFITSGGKPIIGPDGAPLTFLSRRVAKENGVPTGTIGPLAPIPSSSLLTLNAAAFLATGFGIPCAVLDAGQVPATDPRRLHCNQPLPDDFNPATGTPGVVLFPDEVSQLKNRTAEINAVLVATAQGTGYKVFDTSAIFEDIRKNGRSYGGITITTAFLSGGFFSYDGVHPTSLGYAIFTEEFLKFLNANYGTHLAQVDLTPFLFEGNTTGGYPAGLGIPMSPDETRGWAEQIYSPENWLSLKAIFGGDPRPSLSIGDQEAPEPLDRPGHLESRN